MPRPSACPELERLMELRSIYTPESAREKVGLLRALEGRRLGSADEVLAFHELLCYLRAYPDGAALLAAVERALERFAERRDLGRHREALADSGIAGTPIHFRFFFPTAAWLGRRWPARLRLDWSDAELSPRMAAVLPQLVTFSERAALAAAPATPRRKLAALTGTHSTDAVFYLRRIERLPGDSFTREAFHDAVDAAYRLEPGAGGPSRTRARWERAPLVFRRSAPRRDRPDLAVEMRRKPGAVRRLSRQDGAALVALAREAMVTRKRDLDAFSWGNPADVRLVDDGDGLAFAFIGVVPERRLLLQAVHGVLTLRNRVPIGYIQTDTLYRGSELSYNTFETFRGGEASYVFARLLAALGHLFGCRDFRIEPYQLGWHNNEGLASGAWWFYWKLGFRPTDRSVRQVLAQELIALKRDPGHRSSRAVLRKLAAGYLYFSTLADERSWNPPFLAASRVASRLLAERGGPDREGALAAFEEEAARRVGLRSLADLDREERLWWRRWSPLLASLSGLERWSANERRSLLAVVRAKGGEDEYDFVRRFDRHPRLGRAFTRLAAS